MELITEKPVKQFDTSAIAKGNLIYAKHSSWDAGKSGFVTGVNGNEIAVQFHPGIGNVTNHFFILASEAAAVYEYGITHEEEPVENGGQE